MDDLKNFEFLIKPCHWYLEEHRGCNTIYNKLYEYYTEGVTPNCEQWARDYRNCINSEQNNDQESKRLLLESEVERRIARLKVITNESVWQLRDSPPEDWNSELPEKLKPTAEDIEIINSYNSSSSTSCIIM